MRSVHVLIIIVRATRYVAPKVRLAYTPVTLAQFHGGRGCLYFARAYPGERRAVKKTACCVRPTATKARDANAIRFIQYAEPWLLEQTLARVSSYAAKRVDLMDSPTSIQGS